VKTFFPDFHVHSRHSLDSEAEMSAHCEQALQIGLTHLTFTDHLELDPRNPMFGCFDYEKAHADFAEVEDKYGDRISLAFGVEITCQASLAGKIRDAVADKEYDVVMGSVHFIEEFGRDISSRTGTPLVFEQNDPALVYEKYLDEIEASIESNLFDVLGHIGIVHRHGAPYLASLDFGAFEPRFRRIAGAIVESGVAVEMNASGFNHPPNTTYPDERFLRTLVETGFTNVTVGSDAHRPEELGAHVDKTLDIIRGCGLDEIVCFKNRKMTRCKIS